MLAPHHILPTFQANWTPNTSDVEEDLQNPRTGDFPGSPVVKTLRLQCRGHWLHPCLGTNILHVMWCDWGGKKSTQLKKIRKKK